MECTAHPKSSVNANCSECGAGMCDKCTKKGITVAAQPVCAKCAPTALDKLIERTKIWKRLLFKSLIFSSVMMSLGFVIATIGLMQGYTRAAIVGLLVCFGTAGMHAVWNSMQGANNSDMLSNHSGQLLNYFIKFVTAFILGLILTPVNFVRNLKLLKEADGAIASCRQIRKSYSGS